MKVPLYSDLFPQQKRTLWIPTLFASRRLLLGLLLSMSYKRNDSARDGELNFRSDFLRPKGTHQVDVEAPCTVDTLCTLTFFFPLWLDGAGRGRLPQCSPIVRGRRGYNWGALGKTRAANLVRCGFSNSKSALWTQFFCYGSL
jgi:hypothetical protein